MKYWKFLLSLAAVVMLMSPLTFAADDCYEPLQNAVEVKAYGPESSGVTPYGKMNVVTQDGECYEYLTDKGQFIRYKKCDDGQWIEIEHNFIKK